MGSVIEAKGTVTRGVTTADPATVTISVSGTGAAAFIVASVFNVDGAASAELRKGHPEAGFSGGMHGDVLSVSGTSFTVSVTTATTFAAVGTYTVDASKAVYEAGTASCLVAGAQVTVLGVLSGSTLTASEVRIAGCTGQSRSKPGH